MWPEGNAARGDEPELLRKNPDQEMNFPRISNPVHETSLGRELS